jgi:hypothetical protein
VFAYAAGGLYVAREQRVDERGLAHARGADERDCLSASEPGGKRVGFCSYRCVHRQHRDVTGDRARSRYECLGIRTQVGFRQHDHGFDPPVPRDGEIPFEARRVEIVVARRDDEQRVQIGSDRLHALPGACRHARDQRTPLENAKHTWRFVFDEQPVADRHGRVGEPRRHDDVEDAALAQDGDETSLNAADARGIARAQIFERELLRIEG